MFKWFRFNRKIDPKTLPMKLRRWAEIAERVNKSDEWDRSSLLHSFGDKLAKDLKEAAILLEN